MPNTRPRPTSIVTTPLNFASLFIAQTGTHAQVLLVGSAAHRDGAPGAAAALQALTSGQHSHPVAGTARRADPAGAADPVGGARLAPGDSSGRGARTAQGDSGLPTTTGDARRAVLPQLVSMLPRLAHNSGATTTSCNATTRPYRSRRPKASVRRRCPRCRPQPKSRKSGAQGGRPVHIKVGCRWPRPASPWR